jgi:mesencephalic astrocyte-derived neurotrophic factor
VQCYYLNVIKREVSQPFSTGMPKAKVCERLKKKSAEICSVKYRELKLHTHTKTVHRPIEDERGVNCGCAAVKVDTATDYTKLRVKELKAILAERGVECTGCIEKSDFVKKATETAHMDL